MRVLVDHDAAASGEPRTVAISIDSHQATVSDLAAALGLAESALAIDGVVHLADVPLHEVHLVEGSRVAPLGPNAAGRSGIGSSWVGVVSGPAAGVIRRLDADGAVTIGRSEVNDLHVDNSSVSELHAVIERSSSTMSVTDLSSTNGTWLKGKAVGNQTPLRPSEHVRIGSSTIEYREVESDDKPLATSVAHADARGRILFNRPPRGPVAEAPREVAVPDALPDRKNPTLAIVSILVPILIAAVMVVAFDSFRFALFALLSPLLILGNWFSGRRTVKKERSGDARTRREAIDQLQRDLGRAHRAERDKRNQFAPDVLEVRRRVELPSSQLWERRLDSPDALNVRIGLGSIPWNPSGLDLDEEHDAEVAEVLAGYTTLDDIEVVADLRTGPIGFVGDELNARRAARSCLLQLATHHGPADLKVAIATTKDRQDRWSWAQWLPHAFLSNGGVGIYTEDESIEFASATLEALNADESKASRLSPALVIVVDALDALHQKSSPLRQVLERTDQNVFAIVLAPVRDRLPASVATVVSIDRQDGEFVLNYPTRPEVAETGVIDGVAIRVAADIARSMARFDDPELGEAGGSLPDQSTPEDIFPMSLFGTVDASELDTMNSPTSTVRKRWAVSKQREQLVATLGLTESGTFDVDLVRDGPHGLVAGTTGSGKSEFLRTFVLSLASNHDPDDLVFVLIDYKGGSAFDRCARLPHVVGMVTNLDDHLAERALHSLEAELEHRETVLRKADVSDISEYRAAGSQGPLPRLVVVIDEFATLRTELPDFVNSLIGIAQRGRSLGVHLILATQRPTGAVDANIRANANFRVALRVQDAGDSTDVIDDKRAANIGRFVPGRAFVRRGDGDVQAVQTAYVSGAMGLDGPPIRVSASSANASAVSFPVLDTQTGVSYLEHLVEVLNAAAVDRARPRRPWLEELPSDVSCPSDLDGVVQGDDAHVVLALADDPKNQRRVTRGWNLDDGHLAVIGGPGSGVSTAIRSVITAIGSGEEVRPVWVYPIDHGAGGLTGIDDFGHVAPVIAGTDELRQDRLLQFLGTTLDARRSQPAESLDDTPVIIVAIDGVGSFVEVNDVSSSSVNGELLQRLVRDGAAVGIYLVVGASTHGELPRMLRNGIHQRIILEQADERDYFDLGIKLKKLPSFTPGRALVGADAMVAQVIDWEFASTNGSIKVLNPGVPVTMEPLSTKVSLADLPPAQIEPDLSIPFGISDSTRLPAWLSLRPGEHAVVAGPHRSGRTTALRVLASQLRLVDPDLVLVGVSSEDDEGLLDVDVFDAGGSAESLEGVFDACLLEDRRWVIFVDDADRIDIEGGSLFEIARTAPPHATVVASMRGSAARNGFGHWTRFVRASGCGVLLKPDGDGELLGVRLPKQRLVDVPGRGYLVSAGEAEVVQVAHHEM